MKRKLNQRERIERALNGGRRMTSRELASATRLGVHHCSAYLAYLWKRGVLERSDKAEGGSPSKRTGLYLYWRKEIR